MRRQTDARIEQTLVAEARLAAELLGQSARRHGAPIAELDAEADRIGALLGARVTLIAADGRVVGDSSEPLEGARGDGKPRAAAGGRRGAGSAASARAGATATR